MPMPSSWLPDTFRHLASAPAFSRSHVVASERKENVSFWAFASIANTPDSHLADCSARRAGSRNTCASNCRCCPSPMSSTHSSRTWRITRPPNIRERLLDSSALRGLLTNCRACFTEYGAPMVNCRSALIRVRRLEAPIKRGGELLQPQIAQPFCIKDQRADVGDASW